MREVTLVPMPPTLGGAGAVYGGLFRSRVSGGAGR